MKNIVGLDSALLLVLLLPHSENITILDCFAVVGAEVRPNLRSLELFTNVDLADPRSIDMEPFGAGDIGERVRFFKPPLYNDFVDCSIKTLLEFAQSCDKQQVARASH